MWKIEIEETGFRKEILNGQNRRAFIPVDEIGETFFHHRHDGEVFEVNQTEVG